MSVEEVKFKLTCITEGRKDYNKFREQVFIQKSKQLLHPLSKEKAFKGKPEPQNLDKTKETSCSQREIEIARDRGYTIDRFLVYDLRSTSFFLKKDGAL